MATQNAYAVIVEFSVYDSCTTDFIKRAKVQACQSLAEEAKCYRFDICQVEGDKNRVFLYELYEDEQAFKEHLNSTHYFKFCNDVETYVFTKKIVLCQKV